MDAFYWVTLYHPFMYSEFEYTEKHHCTMKNDKFISIPQDTANSNSQQNTALPIYFTNLFYLTQEGILSDFPQ